MLSGFNLNGHTLEFHPQSQKIKTALHTAFFQNWLDIFVMNLL